eukprot:CAMPEP_0118880474 /NCGR_PEP_ID=MMETSP1163-20130328/20018_1 /TAXON_ID=124430 /ORGANISM="Phaeomonas parva, Strain CCMP2877" /LENGTH=185 /DNA_ID=CAMNT_0006816885 /DNA_START=73 /DNA_END=630 /DNA_ORIENTATION=+
MFRRTATVLGLLALCLAGASGFSMSMKIDRRGFVVKTPLAAAGAAAVVSGAAPAFAAKGPKIYKTDGGVEFAVTKEGTGPAAVKGDFVVVDFIGYLSDGKVFDSSTSKGRKPVAFRMGQGQVIKGWEEVLERVNAGSEVQMRVPPAMAFGDDGICVEKDGAKECVVQPGQTVKYQLFVRQIGGAY